MNNIADPVTRWAFIITVMVVVGTCFLVAVAFLRRWQQIRVGRYVRALQRRHRPVIDKLLAGALTASGLTELRALPPGDLEILLDSLLAPGRPPERPLGLLPSLCAELGMIELWQARAAAGRGGDNVLPAHGAGRHLLRAKSLRNLGALRHRPSWNLMVKALDDPHPDVPPVALRALASVGAPEGFPILCERLQSAVQGKRSFLAAVGLQTAMANFDLTCAPDLLPSLGHPDRHIRLSAIQVLRTMIRRKAVRRRRFAVSPEVLTMELVDLLLTQLAEDTVSSIRAYAAEVMVFIDDRRVAGVLQSLLADHQWLVRLRTLQAVADLRLSQTEHLYASIRERLADAHWWVRDAAIRTLLAVGQRGRQQLYEHFLTTHDHSTRAQIVEVMERTGLISSLVEAYSGGNSGLEALLVEQLASEAAPNGLSGILRTLQPDIRQKFLDRFLPYAEAKLRFLDEVPAAIEASLDLQQILDFPSRMTA